MAGSIDWAIEAILGATSVEEIELVLRGSARAGVGAQGATVVRREGDECYYAEEDAVSPLWKGQRFPLSQCISGWAMLHHQSVAIADIRSDSRIPQDAYRPTFVRSLLVVPIGIRSPVGAIGAYWDDHHIATNTEINTLERLAAAVEHALARVHRARGETSGDSDSLVPA